MTALALRSLLAHLLNEIVAKWGADVGVSINPDLPPATWANHPDAIPLKKVKNVRQVCYTSAIALRLAKMSGLCPIEIAKTITALGKDFSKIDEESIQRLPQSLPQAVLAAPAALGRQLWPYVQVDPQGQGYLQLGITDMGVALWLQWLAASPVVKLLPTSSDGGNQAALATIPTNVFSSTLNSSPPNPPSTAPPFIGFYAYARCCSLLRLAQRGGLLQLSSALHRAAPPEPWQIEQPRPLPWLTSNSRLWFQADVEQDLLHQLVQVTDGMASPHQPRSSGQIPPLSPFMQALGHAFTRFYGAYPVRPAQENGHGLEPTQARLGLMSVTARIVQMMFAWGWAIAPPAEL